MVRRAKNFTSLLFAVLFGHVAIMIELANDKSEREPMSQGPDQETLD